jgi:nitrogen regulatory protein PII
MDADFDGAGVADDAGARVFLRRTRAFEERAQHDDDELHLAWVSWVEVVLPDHLVEDAVQAVIAKARTGEIGDGRIFLTPVTASYRIRTGELVM